MSNEQARLITKSQWEEYQQLKNDFEEFTGYFRTVAAPEKRFFVCFSMLSGCLKAERSLRAS